MLVKSFFNRCPITSCECNLHRRLHQNTIAYKARVPVRKKKLFVHSNSAKICNYSNCDYHCDDDISIFICNPTVFNFSSVQKLGREQNINEAWGIEAHYDPSCPLCYHPNVSATRLYLFFHQNAITTHRNYQFCNSIAKTTELTLALLIVGDHQRVNLLLGI